MAPSDIDGYLAEREALLEKSRRFPLPPLRPSMEQLKSTEHTVKQLMEYLDDHEKAQAYERLMAVTREYQRVYVAYHRERQQLYTGHIDHMLARLESIVKDERIPKEVRQEFSILHQELSEARVQLLKEQDEFPPT